MPPVKFILRAKDKPIIPSAKKLVEDIRARQEAESKSQQMTLASLFQINQTNTVIERASNGVESAKRTTRNAASTSNNGTTGSKPSKVTGSKRKRSGDEDPDANHKPSKRYKQLDVPKISPVGGPTSKRKQPAHEDLNAEYKPSKRFKHTPQQTKGSKKPSRLLRSATRDCQLVQLENQDGPVYLPRRAVQALVRANIAAAAQQQKQQAGITQPSNEEEATDDQSDTEHSNDEQSDNEEETYEEGDHEKNAAIVKEINDDWRAQGSRLRTRTGLWSGQKFLVMNLMPVTTAEKRERILKDLSGGRKVGEAHAVGSLQLTEEKKTAAEERGEPIGGDAGGGDSVMEDGDQPAAAHDWDQ